ncbi:CLUMA_CG014604, isoform A [Clunio marinus]|uniref:CLUMA_CG014604, isoform A n=1 Tax=Clunio marinus TaxID=568069 RepID=A0A1J1IPW3_9DIPT|nr:CLUMA_CG014604, isoform A [Clunio marinus]
MIDSIDNLNVADDEEEKVNWRVNYIKLLLHKRALTLLVKSSNYDIFMSHKLSPLILKARPQKNIFEQINEVKGENVKGQA